MKTLTRILAATLTGAILSLAASAALAHGHGHDRGWGHERHGYYRAPVVYAPYYAPRPVYYAPRPVHYGPPPVYYGPPPVVYQPSYYVPRPRPALTIGISPIVIPLN